MDLDDLSSPEKLVLELTQQGEVADLAGGADEVDASEGPTWSDDRVVRAEFVSALCTGELGAVGRRGVEIRGARIVGTLDLAFADIPHPLGLSHCYVDPGDEVDLKYLRIPAVALTGSHVGNVSADGLITSGSVYMNDGFRSTGEVRLMGASIDSLYCSRATFSNEGNDALSADALVARGGILLDEGFEVIGQVRFPQARIGTAVVFQDGRFSNPSGVAVFASDITVGGSVVFRNTTVEGTIMVSRASIGGGFACVDSRLMSPGNTALDAVRASVGGVFTLSLGGSIRGTVNVLDARLGGVFLDDVTLENDKEEAFVGDRMTAESSFIIGPGFEAGGEVRFPGATIGGQVNCRGKFTNPSGSALSCDGLRTRGDLLLRDGFTAVGGVRLAGARVDDFDCRRGSFSNPQGVALWVDGLVASGNVFLNKGFKSVGEVRLRGAKITGQLTCRDGSFSNPGGFALNADGSTVGHGVFFSGEFTAEGEVSVSSAKVDAQFNCRGGTFVNADGTALDYSGTALNGDAFLDGGFCARGKVRSRASSISGSLFCLGEFAGGVVALYGERMEVHGTFTWDPKAKPDGAIDLSDARVGELADEPSKWPARALLDGFTYDTLEPLRSVHDRLQWLGAHCSGKGYVPQPYEQLATIYRAAGHEAEARTVAVAREHARRSTLRRRTRPFHWLFGLVVGYGYRLWRPLFPLAAAVVIGSFLFAQAAEGCRPHYSSPRCAMTPTREIGNLPEFQPMMYSLDTVLPIVDLRQQAFWTPESGYRWWFWSLISSGWIFTTAIVAGFSRAVTRG